MKAVLISIQPRWCERIAAGDKTDEIRKNSPKLPVPFKCYIYQSKTLWGYPILRYLGRMDLLEKLEIGKGKVIGEFICDTVTPVTVDNAKKLERTSCVSLREMWKYAAPKSIFDLKAWRISNLVVYKKPKKLNTFRNPCAEYTKDDPHCGRCDYYLSMGEYPAECACEGAKPMIRPPQSWCYVDELRCTESVPIFFWGGRVKWR